MHLVLVLRGLLSTASGNCSMLNTINCVYCPLRSSSPPFLILHHPFLTSNSSQPTGVQKRAIPAALAGSDLMFRARTGSGKTLAYLLPLAQVPRFLRSFSVCLPLLFFAAAIAPLRFSLPPFSSLPTAIRATAIYCLIIPSPHSLVPSVSITSASRARTAPSPSSSPPRASSPRRSSTSRRSC